MTTPISAIVITKNEEHHLADCIASIAWADEVLVVDSHSTDRTMEIAQQLATRAIQHPFSNFADQRNYAQAQAAHDWVLFVDADERVSAELRDTIHELAHTDRLTRFNGYSWYRVTLFSGRWWPDPAKLIFPTGQLAIERHVPNDMLRLFDRRLGQWERDLHEIVQIPRPHGLLRGVLYHYSTTNLSLAHEPFNRYTDLEAAFLHRTRERINLGEAVLRGIRSFAYHYFSEGLYRYGGQGYVLAVMLGYTKFINYAKLWERIRIQKGEGIWTEQDQQLLERFK